MTNLNATANSHFQRKKRPFRFFNGSTEKIAIIPNNPTERKTITAYLDFYRYRYHVNAFGDVHVIIRANAVELSNLRAALAKLTGTAHGEIGIVFFAGHRS